MFALACLVWQLLVAINRLLRTQLLPLRLMKPPLLKLRLMKLLLKLLRLSKKLRLKKLLRLKKPRLNDLSFTVVD